MALSNPFNPPPNTPIVKQDALTDSIWRRWFEQIWKRIDTGAKGGTVTSVGLSMPTSVFDVANSPITTAGTIAVTFDNQSANTVFAGPTTGSPATPSFRALVTSDLPAGTGTVTSVDVSGGTTGLTTSGGPITTSGTITIAGTLAAANGGTGLTSPGASGNVLTSNGTGWVSSPSTGGGSDLLIIYNNENLEIATNTQVTGHASLTFIGTGNLIIDGTGSLAIL